MITRVEPKRFEIKRTLIRQQSAGGVETRPAPTTPGKQDTFEMETVQVRWHPSTDPATRERVRQSFTVNVNDARVNGEKVSMTMTGAAGAAFFCGRGCWQYPAAGISLSTRFLRYL